MMMRQGESQGRVLTRAIVCRPAESFAEGLTRAGLGAANLGVARRQHADYCQALERCGLRLIFLEPDPAFPDCTFVEDTAVLLPHRVVITRPGAPSRVGEVNPIRRLLGKHFPACSEISAPGTVDGGDVCEAGDKIFIGLSDRTNDHGAAQLAAGLATDGFDPVLVPIHGIDGLLHLKSGLACLGNNTLVIADFLADRPEFRGFDLIRVDAEELYAANCVRINQFVLVASGFPQTDAAIRRAGFQTITLDMSEFRKMDGGLSCLSLRF